MVEKPQTWNEAQLQRFIDDEVPESLSLEYKRGTVLSKNAKKNPKWLEELTKDISALANSAGGLLVYGIAEKDDKPTEFAPVDKTDFSRETLDQIIASNVKPRIDGLTIHPVALSSGDNDVAYVIDIPQSNTAHQAYDKRYHKRLNTTTAWMEDYEIRDVMGRGEHPKIDLEFSFLIETSSFFRESRQEENIFTKQYLQIIAYNSGSVYADYLNAYFEVPKWILDIPDNSFTKHLSYDEYYNQDLRNENKTIYAENTQRSVIYSDSRQESEGYIFSVPRTPEPIRHEPLLPDRRHIWLIEVREDIQDLDLERFRVDWEVYADNSGKNTGYILLNEINFIYEDEVI